MSYDVFISYRRDGGDTLAQLIYDRLKEKGYRIFLDIESLRSGKFNEKLLEVMDECKDVIVILPPNALERCKNPGDWLYLEVSNALKHKKNIIPVMMKGFEWPEEWPEGMEELQNYNGIYDSKDYFDAVIDKIASLLSSKADLKGMQKEKSRLNRKKIFEKIKKKSTIVIGLSITGLIAAGAVFGYKAYQKQKEEEKMSKVTIYLSANEEMNVSEYHESIEAVQKRLDILMDGQSYGFDMEDARVKIQLPIEVFGDTKPMDLIRAYVSRPIDLYLAQSSTKKYIPIERDDILSIEQSKGNVPQIDLEKLGMEPMDEYLYTEICFSEDTMKTVEETFGADYGELMLLQDVEINTTYYGYFLINGTEENQFYLVDNRQSQATNDLVEYNYTHESFEKAFNVSLEMPVEWEKVELAEQPGEYQYDVEKLPENQIMIQYTTVDKNITKGEYLDLIAMVKQRLDALEQPYAIGKVVTGTYDFAVKTSAEYLNDSIVSTLNNSGTSLTVSNPLVYEKIYWGSDEMKYEQLEDGSYILKISTKEDYRLECWNTMVDEILESKNHNLYMKYGEYVLSTIDVAEQEEQIRKGTIVFDNLSGAGYDSLDEEAKPLLNYLTTYIQNNGYTSSYYSYSVTSENEHDIYGLMFKNIDRTAIEKTLQEIWPESTVRVNNTYIFVEWKEAGEPTELLDKVKQMYESLNLNSGEMKAGISVDLGDDRILNLSIDPELLDYHRMEIKIYGTNDYEQYPYVQELKQLLTSDTYFEEELLYIEEK